MKQDELRKIEDVIELIKADWLKHGNGRYNHHLDSTMLRLRRKGESEFEAIISRHFRDDVVGAET